MSPGSPIGIVAGGGGVPLEIADALHRRGIGMHVVGIDGFVDAGVTRFPHTIVGLGQLGSLLEALRRHGCREVLIVGALERPDLRRLRFDLGALWHLPAVLSLTRGGDDSLLRRIVRFFEAQGFIVRGIADVAPALIAPEGLVAGPPMGEAQRAAVMGARAALADLSRFDMGQAVVARPDGLVAVEAAEGTRRMLSRLAAAGGAGRDAVLVKLPKLGQEMRIDLPTIGAGTVAEAAAAGLSAIVVAAGSAVLAERTALVASADASQLSVMGLESDQRVPPPAAEARISTDAARDGEIACELTQTLLRHARPGVRDVGAIVRHAHALAVEIDALDAGGWSDRLSKLPRGWGLPRMRRRAGALVLALTSLPSEAGGVAQIEALVPLLRRAALAALVIQVRGLPDIQPQWAAAVEVAARRSGLVCSVTVMPDDLGRTP